MIALLSPATLPIAGPMLLGLGPSSKEVLTLAESFERHDVPTSQELYEQLRADQSTSIYSPSAPVPPPAHPA